jgi:hypothetical protein
VDRSGVLADKTVVAVSAGVSHNLALCSDGTLAAWGLNGRNGALGNNDTNFSSVPVAVDTSGVLAGKTVIAIAAGSNSSQALCSDGTLAAWGANIYGQLGDNSIAASKVPVAVDRTGLLAGQKVVAIAAGDFHRLVIVAPAPDIAVAQTIALTDAAGGVDFGNVAVGGSAPLTFTITNPGLLELDSLAVTQDGPNTGDFTVSALSATSIPTGGGTVTFTVTFSPTAGGARTAAIHIASNLSGAKNPFDIALSGTGPTALEFWRQTWFGPTATNTGNAADSADPYETGVPNLLVFAFFGPTQDPATAQINQLPQATSAGGVLTYQFVEPAGVSGITYGAQWSATLGNDWLPITDTGTAPEHIFSVPVDGDRKFIRLTVD